MEELQSCSDNYRSSSSSASSPTGRSASASFFYMRKPGFLRQPISFEDSPDWEETEIDRQTEEAGDSIQITTATVSPALSKVNSESLPSPSLENASSSSVTSIKFVGASLVWRDLTVTLRQNLLYSDKVIKSSNGYALPGKLTVIMGPARSGKSTLLRAIAGRLHGSGRIYGEVLVNGVKSDLPYGSCGYVDRDDVLMESLTVREMLHYSSLLQLPGCFYRNKSMIEDVIAAMSLGDYADKLIGGHCTMEKLSPGERRRASIARELVTRPHILFIDEPLYHLDSVAALLLMVTLKKLANTGCTIVFTMYQSSTEVFGLYDRICLLSNGNTLFFGETLACLQHFSNAGFPCPVMQSPADHFLRAINTEFDRIIAMCKNLQDDNSDFSSVNMDTAVAIRTLEATYKSSADSAAVESMIVTLIEKGGPQLKIKGKAGAATRIAVVTWRSVLIMSRDWKYFWVRLLLNLFLGLSIGTIFCNIGHSLSSVMVRVSAIFLFVSFTLLLSLVALPACVREIQIYIHEESHERSGVALFLLGHLLSSIPFLLLMSISSTLLFYFLVGLRNEFGLLMYFVLNVLMCLLANEGLMMVIACICLEAVRGILALLFLNIFMMLVAGYFRIQSDLPYPIWKYPSSYMAFHTYSIQGLLENEYVGTSFAVGQVRAIAGDQAVHSSYDISASARAKWCSLLVLVLMATGYRVFLFALLRLRCLKYYNGSKPWLACWPRSASSSSSSSSKAAA